MSKCQYCGIGEPSRFYALNQRTCKSCISKRNGEYRRKKVKDNGNKLQLIDADQLVACQLCGAKLIRIENHLRVHKITTKKYLDMFPNAQLYSSVWTEKLRKAHLGKPPWNKGKIWVEDDNYARFMWRQQFGHMGQIAWNKGKTKESDLRVAKSANTMSNHVKTSEHCKAISNAKKGKLYPNLIYFLKPNKSEIKLQEILDVHFAGEWVFTGDGKYILNGRKFEVGNKLPDFLNTKTQNQLIELCGEYWHRNDNPEERVEYFRGFGFETLIVWGKELRDEKSLILKLKGFVR